MEEFCWKKVGIFGEELCNLGCVALPGASIRQSGMEAEFV